MDITEREQKKIKDFFDACNEMIGGKFILSDIKISKILKSIATCETLYKLFEKSLINFNFDREFKNAKVTNRVNGGYFLMPTEENRIIALVFCLLLEVDNQKINLQSFVNENFYNADGYNISYNNFAINVLVPFKTSVMNMLGVSETGEPKPVDESLQLTVEELVDDGANAEGEDHQTKILLANLRMALNELYSVAKRTRRLNSEQREEYIIVLNAMHEAINIGNLKIINALLIPLKETSSKDKMMASYFRNLTNCIVDYYYK